MKYRPEIDGLRAVAVLPVLLFHGGLSGFSGGFLGVDVFFVISGFLITGILVRDLDRGTFSFRTFYLRRLRRLMPVLFVVMALTTVVSSVVLLPAALRDFGLRLAAVFTYTHNMVTWRTLNYFMREAELSPLLHCWSLSVEEQFYLFYPGLLLVLWRWGRGRVLGFMAAAAVASLLLATVLTVRSPPAAFFLLPTRAWEMAAGGMLALWKGPLPEGNRAEALGLAGLLAIGVAMATTNFGMPSPGPGTLPVVLGTVAVIAGATPQTLVGRMLSTRPFVWTGLVSYSLYLWHQPVLALARESAPDGHLAPSTVLGLLAVSCVLAVASYRWVETPFRAPREGVPVFALTGVLSAAFVAIGLGMYATDGLPGRFGSDVLEPFTSVVDDSPDDRCNWNKAVGYPEVPCVRGAPGTAASWALYGDSHARMYAEALEKRLGARGESFVQLTHASCPVAPGLCSRAAPRCAAFHDLALERMADPAVQTVVVVTRWNLHRRVRGIEPPHCTDGLGSKVGVEDYEARVIERIRALVAMGKRVVVLGGSPELGTDVPYTNAKRFQRGEPALARRREEAVDTESTRFLEALGTDVLLYQPADILCPEGICETHVDHTSWYRDDNHATLPAALLVLDDLMGRLER